MAASIDVSSDREMSIRALHAAQAPAAPPSRVLAVNTDPEMLALLREWIDGRGFEVIAEGAEPAANGVDMVVVDVPFPRRGRLHALERIREAHPHAAIVVMSSSFFADVRSDGGVARTLGVASVLPKPFTRDALLAALDRAARRE